MSATTTGPDVEGGYSPTTNVLVVLGSITGVISGLFSMAIMGIILLQRRRRREQQDRLLLGMIGHNFMFSLINAVPFDYNASAGVTNGDYCWWRGWWFGTSYGIVFYVLFMLLAALYVLFFETTLPVKGEVAGHVLFNIGAVIALVLFMVPCYGEYDGELDSGSDDNGAGDSMVETVLFPEMRGQLVLVLLGFVLWAVMWWNSRKLEAQWRQMMAALDMVEDQSVKEDEMDQVLLSYGKHSRELRYYPVIFLLFGIPALTFFTDDCYNEDNCRHGVEFVLVLRSLAIIAWFFIIEANRKDFLRFPAICREFWHNVTNSSEGDGDGDRRYSHKSSMSSSRSRGLSDRLSRSGASQQGSIKDMNQRLIYQDSELTAAGSRLSLLGGDAAGWSGPHGGGEYDNDDDAGAAGGVGAGIQYDLFQDENNLLRCESMLLPRKPSIVARRERNPSARARAPTVTATAEAPEPGQPGWPLPGTDGNSLAPALAATDRGGGLSAATVRTADPQYAEIDDLSAEEYCPPEDQAEDPAIRSPGAPTTSAW